MYRHPTDSIQWKKFDDEFPEFGKESRNIRLGLATNGMNLFGNMSTNHNSWLVLLVIYNLPPGLCMKKKYMMLFMMISDPRQLGNDIDVYLSPLIEDLKLMSDQGMKYLTDLLMKLSRCMSCYFSSSMTFQHMVSYQGIMLRVIKHNNMQRRHRLLIIETWKEDNIASR